MEECVGRLLLEKKQYLGIGRILHRRPDQPTALPAVAGSSAYYLGGAVTYANEAKSIFSA